MRGRLDTVEWHSLTPEGLARLDTLPPDFSVVLDKFLETADSSTPLGVNSPPSSKGANGGRPFYRGSDTVGHISWPKSVDEPSPWSRLFKLLLHRSKSII